MTQDALTELLDPKEGDLQVVVVILDGYGTKEREVVSAVKEGKRLVLRVR